MSQTRREKDIFRRESCCFSVKTPGFSHQNLQKQKQGHSILSSCWPLPTLPKEVTGHMRSSTCAGAGVSPPTGQCPATSEKGSVQPSWVPVPLACLHRGSAGTAGPGGRPGEAPLGLFLPGAQQWPLSRCQCCQGSCRDPAACWPASRSSAQHSAPPASVAVRGHNSLSRSCTLGWRGRGCFIPGTSCSWLPLGTDPLQLYQPPKSRLTVFGTGEVVSCGFLCVALQLGGN